MILTEIAKRRCGPAAADVLAAPFVLGDEDALRELFNDARVDEPAIALRDGVINFPSIAVFVETEVKGSPLETLLDVQRYQGLMQEAQEKLQRFHTEAGDVVIPMDAFIVTATRA